ncbi:MAG TPA: ATP-binding protein [Gemmatimonadaceae bacterium]|nr:ATP-binding protein [Gemmatimonadaceae bacterium]
MMSFMLISGVVVMLTCGAFVVNELLTFKEKAFQGLKTLGDVIASNSTASLAFDNDADATEVLSALKARPQIVAAALYDRNGRLFARYPASAPASGFRTTPALDGFRDEQEYLVAYLPVVQGDNNRLGTLYLASNKQAVYDRLTRYAWLALAVMILSLVVAYLLAAFLQRQISRPVLAMAETARAISQRGDYAVRATKVGDDEFGLLTDAFNHMLEQIEVQNRAIRESHERLNLALKASGVGTWNLDLGENRISFDEFANPLFGYPAGAYDAAYNLFLEMVHRDDRPRVESEMRNARANVDGYDSSFRVLWPDGSTHDLSARGKVVAGTDQELTQMTGVIWDVTERKRAEERLAQLLAELERSNKELELFAYVASHDLQEPLRMISSYTQLLERRYSEKLDDDAREFIGYAVDGATRMQRLINDLLEFSRVGTRGKPLAPTDTAELLGNVRANLSVAIEESGAILTNDAMPVVTADAGQLGQLLQNLIGNALKFRNGSRPHVHVSAVETPQHWEVSVSDNGIGIEPQYFDRIFVVFQRLHTKGDYPGTGIGLALCKRIVERHGGRIWVESKLNEGSTFFFTIPKLAHTKTT